MADARGLRQTRRPARIDEEEEIASTPRRAQARIDGRGREAREPLVEGDGRDVARRRVRRRVGCGALALRHE
jgi:hypothetical protein